MTISPAHLVDGALLITEQQNQELLDAVAASTFDGGDWVRELLNPVFGAAEAQATWGITIVVVPADGRVIDVGGAKRAFCGTDRAIYVADVTQLPKVRMGMLALLRGGQS